MSCAVIFGGSGFIGSQAVRALAKACADLFLTTEAAQP